MKTILVPTDLSPAAEYAARYAFQLAKGMKANLQLFNAIIVPAAAPMAAISAWPVVDYEAADQQTTAELKTLADKLIWENATIEAQSSFQPSITYKTEVGAVKDLVCELAHKEKPNLVVMGRSGISGLQRFFFGSNTSDMIDAANFPVLLTPPGVEFKGIHKIAFATDLNPGDLDVIHSLVGLAAAFNAELLLVHITGEKYDLKDHQHKIQAFLSDIACKINYSKIYYRHVEHMGIDKGLDWLSQYGQIDLLAMVHRNSDVFKRIIKPSHTQKLAEHIELPLLVFPPDCCAVL